MRGEVRHGIRSHDGVVAELRADAFLDVTPTIRVSGGPRLMVASADYFDAYYGVDAGGSGRHPACRSTIRAAVSESVGVGGAIDWKTTDQFTTSLFGEYAAPASDRPPIPASCEERGSENQFTVGVSATYRFDFTM